MEAYVLFISTKTAFKCPRTSKVVTAYFNRKYRLQSRLWGRKRIRHFFNVCTVGHKY